MAKSVTNHIFRGRTIAEAMAKATTKLGKDIHIVERREIRVENLFSKLSSGKLGGESLAVELEVSVEPPLAPAEKTPLPPAGNPRLRTYLKAIEAAERHSPADRQAMAAAAAPFASVGQAATGMSGRLDELQRTDERILREIADMREESRMFISLQARGGVPAVAPEFLAHYRNLCSRDVEGDLARQIIEELYGDNSGLAGPDAILNELRRVVAKRIPAAGPLLLSEGKPTVVALVGPSGVGKSTSVIKLAIQFAMRGGKSVGVINEDLRRPGADGQIHNFGRLFGLSVITASEPSGIRDVVKSMAGRDLILIDTGGRSPRDAKGLDYLAEIVKAAGADETHLLLASVSSEKTLLETAARFKPVGFNRLILTKLDECLSYGSILNVAARLADGFSYLTSGPDYANSIRSADSGFLADLVLGLADIDVGDAEASGSGEEDETA